MSVCVSGRMACWTLIKRTDEADTIVLCVSNSYGGYVLALIHTFEVAVKEDVHSVSERPHQPPERSQVAFFLRLQQSNKNAPELAFYSARIKKSSSRR